MFGQHVEPVVSFWVIAEQFFLLFRAVGACQQRAVAVHAGYEAVSVISLQHGDEPFFAIHNVHGKHTVGMLIEYLLRLGAHYFCSHRIGLVGYLPIGTGLQVDGKHLALALFALTVAAVEYHFVAYKGIVVKVKTRVVALAVDESHHAVTRVAVYPLVGHVLTCFNSRDVLAIHAERKDGQGHGDDLFLLHIIR